MKSWMPLMLAAGLGLLVAGVAGAEEVGAPELEAPDSAMVEPEVQASEAELPPAPSEMAPEETGSEEPMDVPVADAAASAEQPEAGAAPEMAELQPEPVSPESLESAEAEAQVPAALDPAMEGAAAPEQADNGVTLGPVGYDSEGREGRIHVVVVGDTLWDISHAYLGTSWVWPSIWQDNRGIENPHLIYPGDRIWITDGEMRVVSRDEAEALLAGQPASLDADPEEIAEEVVPAPAPVLAAEPRMQTVSTRASAGFISAGEYEAAASVLDGAQDKVMLSEGDQVYIGLGAGDAAEGDRFTVFRKRERVFDPDTGRLLGFHVDLLGWVEVREPAEEASLAVIRKSDSEIESGDRLIPYEEIPGEIAVLPPPNGVEGKVSFFAQSRTMMAMDDYVYLNRGTLDGVEVGSPLEVYRPAYTARETARGTRVEVPTRVVAQLLVVKAQPNSSVAFVTHTETEIELGDYVRAPAP